MLKALVAATLIAFAAMPTVSHAVETKGGVTAGGAKTKAAKVRTNKGVTGTVGVTTGAGVMELTAQECTDLGGTVYEGGNFCNTGKYCGTTDQNGKRNRVCLEAAQ